MKKMQNANMSKGKDKPRGPEADFAEVVEAVFLFIHNNYAEFSAILKNQKINYSQYAALLIIYMYGSISEGELARMLLLNPSSVSRMVFGLEKKGWLRATRDQADRRKVMVSLTAQGKRRMETMKQMQAQVLSRLAESLAPDAKEYVYEVLDQVNQALRYLTSLESGDGREGNNPPTSPQ